MTPPDALDDPAVPPHPEEAPTLVLGRRQRLGDQLYGQILEQIVSGRLKQGMRLPPETQICAMFGVSRPVVRQALLRLGADGLVQARQGSGTFVVARPSDRIADFAEPKQIAEFLRCNEVRLVLEGSAARLCAERRTEQDLARIIEARDAFAREAAAGATTAATDLAFHTRIAEASGNEFYPLLLGQLHEALSGFMALALLLTRTSLSERIAQVVHEHAAIVEAVAAREGEAAQVAMQFHINQARRRMIDRRKDEPKSG